MKLQPSETLLIGKWISKAGQTVADETCQRIETLFKNYLTEIGRDHSGWNVLYRDPSDNRLWELSYPDSGDEGGGPPQLRFMTREEAHQKYPDKGVKS